MEIHVNDIVIVGKEVLTVWYVSDQHFKAKETEQIYEVKDISTVLYRHTKPSGCPTTRIEQEQTFETLLDLFWKDYRAFLLEKDSKYGSLYLNPLNKLIKLSSKDRILSRLEEKLGRLLNGNLDDNTLDDILGLLIHLKVAIQNK